jgi:hypothetical protein
MVAHPAFRHWIEPASPGLARSPQKQTVNPLISLAFRFLPARVGSDSRKMGPVDDPACICSDSRRMGSADECDDPAPMTASTTSWVDTSGLVPRPSMAHVGTSKLNDSVPRPSMARSGVDVSSDFN